MAETILTNEAHGRLVNELAELETAGRDAVRERIQTAREEGDLKENSEYHEAKDDQGLMEARILELRAVLETARIDDGPLDLSTVTPGVRVTLVDEDGDEDVYAFTSTLNKTHDDVALISPESPLGAAIAGKSVGDKASYSAPAGVFEVEVVSIDEL